MIENPPHGLTAEELRRRCDPDALRRNAPPDALGGGLVGQDRAVRAMRLSVEIRHSDFNLFVLGPPGTGRHTTVERILHDRAAGRAAPPDWAYVNNFDDPQKPLALELPAGSATGLRQEMERVVDDLATDIPALFESEEYQSQRKAIDARFQARHEEAMGDLDKRARAEGVAVVRTPMGFMVVATRDGAPIKKEDYEKLPEDEQTEIDEKVSRFEAMLSEVLAGAPRIEREHRARVGELNTDMAERVVSARIDAARAVLNGTEAVSAYLDRVRADMIENPELFLQSAARKADGPFPDAVPNSHGDPAFRRYRVNVIVAQHGRSEAGAPVVIEDLPTLDRLVGRIEHMSHMGSLVTDFMLIRPGALHRANGGYLVMDARRILSEPYAWDALKRSLKKRSIVITSLAERMSFMSTTSLEPDPIPLDVRVVLVGDRMMHALLVMLDPEFNELFKVQADFEEALDRSDEATAGLAAVVRAYGEREGLLPLADSGVARLLDEAVRIAGDARKLSLRLSPMADILREAEHYAQSEMRKEVTAADIDRAVDERDHRASRIRDRIQESIGRGIVRIDTEGEEVGQINGLSVLELGDYRFGRPSRITARTRMGGGKLVDIEREVELGGPLHSKGVLILSGYLTSTYALDVPFSLHASLVFEQSYSGIEGDSASCAELLALLSSLSGLPIRQSFAVTGSVNQLGEVQAIGGVNEKIEGFFDVCAGRGLTGGQGVLIPQTNVDHLMLRDRVVDAVSSGRFHIVPIATVDQGIEILTGVPRGERSADGHFPEGSVNARVETRLHDFAEARKSFMSKGKRPGEEGD